MEKILRMFIVSFFLLIVGVYRSLLCCTTELKSYLWESCSVEGASELNEKRLIPNKFPSTSFLRKSKSVMMILLDNEL